MTHSLRTLAAIATTGLLLTTGCIDTTGLVFDGSGGGSSSGGVPTGSYAAVVLSDSPLAYWPLDEVANDVFTEDATGNGHDAFASNSGVVSFGVAGALENGSAVSLADGGVLSVEVPHPLSLAATSYTLETWVRLEGNTAAALWNCKTSDDGYDTVIDAGDDSLYHKRYGEAGFETVSLDLVGPVEFQHLAFVYDQDTATGQWFVNGAPATPTEPLSLSWPTQPTAFQLGRGDYMSGTELILDEVAVYDVVLSTERLEAHYRCGAAQQCD